MMEKKDKNAEILRECLEKYGQKLDITEVQQRCIYDAMEKAGENAHDSTVTTLGICVLIAVSVAAIVMAISK